MGTVQRAAPCAIVVLAVLVSACGGAQSSTASAGDPGPTRPLASSDRPLSTPATIATPAPLPLAAMDRWIAYSIGDATHASVRLVKTNGLDNHPVASDAGTFSKHPEWLPDGLGLVFSKIDGDVASIWAWDLPSDRSTEIVPCTGTCLGYEEGNPSADGTRIAYLAYRKPLDDVVVAGETIQIPSVCALEVTTIASGKQEVLESDPCGSVERRGPRWSPGGDLAYFRTTQDVRGGPVVSTELVVRSAKTGEEVVLAAHPGWDGRDSLDWSTDGQSIAYAADGRLLWVHVDGTGGGVLIEAMAGVDAGPSHVRYLRDGSITFDWVVGPFDRPTSIRLYAIGGGGGTPVEILPEGAPGTIDHYNWGSVQPGT
jgi:hypothetical protein